MIVAGIWFGQHPIVNTFMQPSKEELRDLESYYNHFKKIVEVCFLLNKNSITQNDLDVSSSLLITFHEQFMILYGSIILSTVSLTLFLIGERYATINLHYLLHLPECVQDLDPLWANTCYEFESANGTLKKLLHGTQKVDIQVII